jgi:hypothetical protein
MRRLRKSHRERQSLRLPGVDGGVVQLTREALVAFFQGITIRGVGGQALPFSGEGTSPPTWLTEGPIGLSLLIMAESSDSFTARVLVYDPLYEEENDFRCM